MEAVFNKIQGDLSTETEPTRANATDVLIELRKMNKNNVEFYGALMVEFKLLKTSREADHAKIVKLETDALQHKTAVDEQLSGFETRLVALETDQAVLKKENQCLKEKTLELECRSRKRNLIFKVDEVRGANNSESYEQLYDKIMYIMEHKLGIIGARNMLFRNIHRLGKYDPRRPRNVIVAFLHQPDVDKVLLAAKDIQSPDVSIRTDLPREYNEMRNALLKIRREYRDRDVDPIRCKLTYIKFCPVLFKPVPGGDDVQVKLERGADGKFREVGDLYH